MAATEIDDFKRGDTVILTLTFDADVTGAVLFMTMKSDSDLTDANAEVQVNAVFGAAGGDPAYPSEVRTATITIPHSTTKDLAVRKYFMDMELVQTGDIVTTFLTQFIKVLKDITIKIA